MFTLFLAIACLRSYAGSLPIPDILDTRDPHQSIAQNPKFRTRFDIVWSCFLTIFLCTWVAVHPNVPPHDERRLRSLLSRFWIRIKLMLLTLVVPELVLIWAFRQWAAARYIAELFQDAGWTPAHGHLLIMGGFTLCRKVDGAEMETVLDYESFCEIFKIKVDNKEEERSEEGEDRSEEEEPERRRRMHPLVELTERRILSRHIWPGSMVMRYRPFWVAPTSRFTEPVEISFPTITHAEISDKSKGDFISKIIVVFQALWFIVQCVARWKQGLAVTELELVTVAIASLNGVMYFFWWDKPLSVDEPIKVYLKNTNPTTKNIDEKQVLNHFEASRANLLVERLTKLTSESNRPFMDLISFFWNLLFVEPSSSAYRQLMGFLSFCYNMLFVKLPSSAYQFLRGLISSCRNMIGRLYSSIRHTPSSVVETWKWLEEKLPFMQYLWPFYAFIFLPVFLLLLVLIAILSSLFAVAFFAIALFDGFLAVAYTPFVEANATHVPIFYAPHISAGVIPILIIVLPLISVVFGALHCVAWNFQFPSPAEQWLWRLTSLAITIIPSLHFVYVIAALPVAFVVALVATTVATIGRYLYHWLPLPLSFSFSLPKIVVTILKHVGIFLLIIVIGTPAIILVLILGILMIASVLEYVVARLSLLTQAIVLLRQQPESAFQVVNWTRFIPHI